MMKYPIFIPSRGRYNNPLTAPLLSKTNVPYLLVVEDKEYREYARVFGEKRLLKLDGSDFGCVGYARAFIKTYAEKMGYPYHWQMDDDIAGFMEVKERKTLSTDTKYVLTSIEKWVDQYSNVGMAGIGSNVFGRLQEKPFLINRFAYTCMLIKTDMPIQWRRGIEEDLDFNLQCLKAGFCTVQFNQFLFKWATTGTRVGGYTDLNSQNKRLKRQQKTLELWPEFNFQLKPKGDGMRIDTSKVWRQFTQELKPK